MRPPRRLPVDRSAPAPHQPQQPRLDHRAGERRREVVRGAERGVEQHQRADELRPAHCELERGDCAGGSASQEQSGISINPRRLPAPDECRGVSSKAGGVDKSGPWKLDALECEDFGELVEVGVAMEQRNTAVFSSGCGDQRIG
jgi:hypothetical protein